MSLQVWLPLTKDLRQQGLSNATVTNNGATFNSAGKLGGCYEFASGKRIQTTLPSTSNLNSKAISFACWVNVSSWNSSYDCLMSIADGTGWQQSRATLCRNNTASTLCWNIADGSTSTRVYTTTSLSTNTWYHIACTYDGASLKIYVNGTLNNSAAATLNIGYAGTFNIGGWSGNNYPINCKMNDVRVYSHCLSPMEVKELAKGLVLHYPLNGNNETLVPFGYQQLEYIEGNGSSYFNTGYKFNPEIDACKVEFKGNDVSNNGMIFADSGSKYFWFYYYGSNGIRIYADNGSGQQGIAGISSDLNKHIMEYKNKHYYIDGVDKGSLSKIYTEDTNTIWLFSYGGSSYPFKGRIYYTDIKRNDKIQKIYIPVKRISDSAVGMYELINNDFFVSASTAFTAGPVVKTPSIIYDCSGFINNGIISGNLVVSNDTPKYQASTYMPKAALITHPRPVFGGVDQEWTCAIWVKLDDLSSSQALNNFNRSNYLTTGTNALLYLNDGTNDYYNYANTKLTAGVWTHVVFVFKNSNVIKRIYFNGIDKTNTSGPNKTSTPAGIPDTVTVGTNLAGYISDYRIYATALSATDVLSLYQNSAYIDSSGNVYGAVHTEV